MTRDNGGDESSYALIVSFDDQSESYVHGFEAGGIWQRMKAGAEAEIEAMVHTANRETLSRMAIAEGWTVEFKPTSLEEWTEMEMVKTKAPSERANPHGLRVV